MNPITISPVTKDIRIKFSNEDVSLPQELQVKIDDYWNELLDLGRPYKRGEVFTVTDVSETTDVIEVLVQKTDYAHYLYSQNVDPLGEHSVRIIHTAGPVITSDNYVILGEMGPQTAAAGKYQLCGGGLDEGDLTVDGYLDAEHNVTQEFQEEFGVDVTDSNRVASFGLKYFKTGGPTGKMTLTYEVKLKETKEEFLAKYAQFENSLKEKGELPEFGRVLAFSLDDKKPLQDFLKEHAEKQDEYMAPLLEYILEENEYPESEVKFPTLDKGKIR